MKPTRGEQINKQINLVKQKNAAMRRICAYIKFGATSDEYTDISAIGPQAPSRAASEIEVQPMSSTSSSPDVSALGPQAPSRGASEIEVQPMSSTSSSADVSDVGPQAPSRGASEIEVHPMSSTSSSPDVSALDRGHGAMPTSHVPSLGASEVEVDYPVGLGRGRAARCLGCRR